MGTVVVLSIARLRISGREGDDMLGDSALVRVRVRGQERHRIAILIARGGIHLCIDCGRIPSKDCLNLALRVDKFKPMGPFDSPQAGNALAGADLGQRLGAALPQQRRLDRLLSPAQLLFQPYLHQPQAAAVGLDASIELGDPGR